MNESKQALNRKEFAEFLRYGLITRLCSVEEVVRWAESVVASEEKPHVSFIDLCVVDDLSPAEVQALLTHVPGDAASDIPVGLLLGRAHRLHSTEEIQPDDLLMRLYRGALISSQSRVPFPERVYHQLAWLEDELSLAQDEVCGNMEEFDKHLAEFLEPWGKDAR